MVKQTCPMTLNKEHYTVMANDIVKGKQSMTLQEAKLLRLLITQVVKQDKDLKTYTCRITDLAEFLGVSRNNLYRDVQNICENLTKSIVKIGTGNPKQPWKIINWVSCAEYDGNGTLKLMLSDNIRPYVLDLNSWLTQYKLGNILSFQSFYAIRLYELLTCDDGITRHEKDFHEYSIEYLRQYFDCEKKYEKISQFKAKVIDVAIREINEKSNLWVEIEYCKTGRAITSIRLHIHEAKLMRDMSNQLSFDDFQDGSSL